MFRTNKYLAAGIGTSLGLGKTIVDSDDDTLTTTMINMGVGGTLGYATNEMIDYLMNKTGMFKFPEEEKVRKEVVRGITEDNSKQLIDKDQRMTTASMNKEKVRARAEAKLENRAEMKMLRRAKTAGKIGLGAFALATVLDINESIERDIRVKEMLKQQEENAKRKMRRPIWEKRWEKIKEDFENVDMGKLALQLFEERIGHYKMGNAKFE